MGHGSCDCMGELMRPEGWNPHIKEPRDEKMLDLYFCLGLLVLLALTFVGFWLSH